MEKDTDMYVLLYSRLLFELKIIHDATNTMIGKELSTRENIKKNLKNIQKCLYVISSNLSNA